MTTSDPFSSDHVPTPDADPSQPLENALGYASPPPYSQPSTYPQPYYESHWRRPEKPPLDTVSVVSFGTGLAALGPVAAILGGIGLVRTAKGIRSGRWMAWTGLALGVVSTIVWIAFVAVLGNLQDTSAGYGSDPFLDTLWDACDAGDMAACDDLFVKSPLGSEYEEFGGNCGTAGRDFLEGFCAF